MHWDSQMWESWDTMGELGHGPGTLVMAQLPHIGRVGPLCGRVGPCNDNLFFVLSMTIVIKMFIIELFLFYSCVVSILT